MPRLDVAYVVVVAGRGLLLLAAAAAAQTTTSTIEGTVTDASGAVIPGAEVTVRGATLAAERRATTDAQGRLPPDGAAGRDLHRHGHRHRPRRQRRHARGDAQPRRHLRRDAAGRRRPGDDRREHAGARSVDLGDRRRRSRRARSPNCRSTAATTSTCCSWCPASPSTARSIPNTDRVQPGAGRAQRQQQFPDRRAVEQGHRQRRARAAVQPGNHRRVPGADQRLQGRVRAGVGRDRQRHHQERQQSLQRRRLAVPQGRCARCVELAGRDADRAAAAAPLRLEPRARRSAAQGQGVLLRVRGAHQREAPARFQVSGHRQRGGQPAAARAGRAVRRADASSRRRARSSSSTNASDSTS